MKFLIDRNELPYDAFVPDPSWLIPYEEEGDETDDEKCWLSTAGGEDDQCDHDRTAQCVFPQQEMISVGNTGWNEAYQASHETLLEVLHKMM